MRPEVTPLQIDWTNPFYPKSIFLGSYIPYLLANGCSIPSFTTFNVQITFALRLAHFIPCHKGDSILIIQAIPKKVSTNLLYFMGDRFGKNEYTCPVYLHWIQNWINQDQPTSIGCRWPHDLLQGSWPLHFKGQRCFKILLWGFRSWCELWEITYIFWWRKWFLEGSFHCPSWFPSRSFTYEIPWSHTFSKKWNQTDYQILIDKMTNRLTYLTSRQTRVCEKTSLSICSQRRMNRKK